MQNFDQIFNSFSSRNDLSGKKIKPLTYDFKFRTLKYCSGVHGSAFFWNKVQEKFLYLVPGTLAINPNIHPFDNLAPFLETCADEYFLDLIEFVFQEQKPIPPHRWERRGSYIYPPREHGKIAPESINRFLDLDELPYYVTDYVWEATSESSRRVTRLPQVICRDNELLHTTIVEPVISLLGNKPHLYVADEEFSDALSDYRKQRFRDCVTKCYNALESTMKVICKKNKWNSKPENLSADKLLRIIIGNTSLNDSYLKINQMVESVRSNQGSSHAGLTKRTVSRSVAQFVINLTGAAILLLVEESGL